MRVFAAVVLAATAVFSFPAGAALVGSLTAVGDTITFPVVFDRPLFNSAIDAPGGLSFAIAPGLSAPVELQILTGTKNVVVAAGAIGDAFGITDKLPLSIISDTLATGIHPFALGAFASGPPGSAIIARLTLTPIPGSLLLLAPAVAAFGWNYARRRPPAAVA